MGAQASRGVENCVSLGFDGALSTMVAVFSQPLLAVWAQFLNFH